MNHCWRKGNFWIIIIWLTKENEYKVGLLHNEVFVDIPGCNTNDKWCDFNKFISLFHPNVTSCDFSRICETDNNGFEPVTSIVGDTSDTIKVDYPSQGEDDRYWFLFVCANVQWVIVHYHENSFCKFIMSFLWLKEGIFDRNYNA